MSDGRRAAGRIARGSGSLTLAGLAALLPLLLPLPACAAVTAGPGATPSASPPAALPPPPLPANLPAERDPGWGGLLNQQGDPRTAPYGVGRLGPADPSAISGVDWARGIALPIYAAPAGSLRGWLARGWWIPAGDKPRPMPLGCLLETDYETASFVLYEIRDDGWLRIGVEPPCDGGGFWLHRGHLGLGSQALAVQTWGERFLSGSISPLYFRDRQRHALRASPAPEADRIAWIGEADTFDALEIEGDWMRVRLSQPSSYCKDPETWKGRIAEGWLRWRDPMQGPWIWYFTRGC